MTCCEHCPYETECDRERYLACLIRCTYSEDPEEWERGYKEFKEKEDWQKRCKNNKIKEDL